MASPPREALMSSTWAVMEWEFEPRQDHDLSVAEGEHVLVVKRIDENWFLAENEAGERGYVPTAYARIERSATKIVRAASKGSTPRASSPSSSADGRRRKSEQRQRGKIQAKGKRCVERVKQLTTPPPPAAAKQPSLASWKKASERTAWSPTRSSASKV